MKYISLFSGIGGFEVGIKKAYENFNRHCLQEPTAEDLHNDGADGSGLRKRGGENAVCDGRSNFNEQSNENTCHQFSNAESESSKLDEDVSVQQRETIQEVSRGGRWDGDFDEGRRSVLSGDKFIMRPICVGYSEIDRHAISIYSKQFSNHKNHGDITKIDPGSLPDFDLVVGGFPCQSFSIAGQRRGFEDTRGTLFFEIARIIKQKRPRVLLLENVKGLLSHDNGRTFSVIIATLCDLGYCVEWQVLNSKDFGVPQNRERVFIVGHLGRFPGRKVFPILSNNRKDFAICEGTAEISPTITCHYAKNQSDAPYVMHEQPKIMEVTGNTSLSNRVYNIEGISPTIKGEGGGMGAKTGLYSIPVLTPNRIEQRQEGRRFKEPGDPSFTLTAQDRHGVTDGVRIRRLTPKECERLQGFPDDWTKFGINDKGKEVEVSDSQRYKCAGNAVTTNVVQAVMESIFESYK